MKASLGQYANWEWISNYTVTVVVIIIISDIYHREDQQMGPTARGHEEEK